MASHVCEFRLRVLPAQNLHEGVHIQRQESTVDGQARCIVAHEQVVLAIEQPDVSFDTSAAKVQGLVERDSAPIVVVRMTRNWNDVASEVGGIV